jgi:hypothetical protein
MTAMRERVCLEERCSAEGLIGDKARGQINPIIFLALALTGGQCYRTLQDALERLKIDPQGADIAH